MADSTPPKLIKLYQELADLTLPECRLVCKKPYSCCSSEYCEFSMHLAKQRGVTLEPTGHARLPLMGPTGCIAPPHLRPMCTAHTCEMAGLGYKKGDTEGKWSIRYFDLRSLIGQAEMALIDDQQL